MLTRNLESVFCLSISKSQGEARNLESGWPEPRTWKLVYSRNPGSPPPPAHSLTVQCVRLPPVLLNRYRSILFLGVLWKLGILESGNCDHFTGSMHVSRTRNALATFARPSLGILRPARATVWPERASGARRGRLGIASEHPRILAAPADARRIESRAALRRHRHLLSCDGRINGHAGATSARLDLRGACQVSRHRRAIGSGWRCRRFDWLLNKSYYLSDLSLDTVVTRRCRVYLCVLCESTYEMVSEGTIGK